MTDASFRSAAYALMIEDNPDQKIQSKRKIKNFLPIATQNVNLLERIPGNLHGLSRVCTHFVGSNKTNNRSDR